MNKTLSIVVPVYNVEKYLKRCLDSILFEDVLDSIEVIAVNDGSKDSSLSILKSYEEKYPKNFILVDKENGGHGSTVNAGLEIAQGKYFKVLDSDDWFNPVDFELFLKEIKNIEVDLIVTNHRQDNIYTGESSLYQYTGLIPRKKYLFDKFNLEDLHGDYFIMQHSFYKTEILRKSGLKLLEKSFYVDMQFNTVPIREVHSFMFLPYDIYRYFIGRKDQSVDLKSFVKNKKQHEMVLKWMIEDFNNIKRTLSPNKKKYLKMILRYMTYTHYMIFCTYDDDKFHARKEIRDFDRYLARTDRDLYEASDQYPLIKIHRKSKFMTIFLNKYSLDWLEEINNKIFNSKKK